MSEFRNDHPFAPWNRWPGRGPWEDPEFRHDPAAPWNIPGPDSTSVEEGIYVWNDEHPEHPISLLTILGDPSLRLPPVEQGRPTLRHVFDDRYDFDYRPATYFPELPSIEELLSKIKGTARRDVARRALAGEQLPHLGDDELYREAIEFVFSDVLDDAERDSWGRLHPALMGGEYLPELEEGEVEIVRIELQSTTADVIQVRAKPVGDNSGEDASAGRIRYRVVDEYTDIPEHNPECSPELSDQPLNLGEIIDLIDSSSDSMTDPDQSYIDSMRSNNYDPEADPETLRHFVSVSSWYYPQLKAYYEDRAEAWCRAPTGTAF